MFYIGFVIFSIIGIIISLASLSWLNELCDVLPFNSHLIRKTFATTLHENGVPTKIISDLMGHAEIRTTEKFYIISSGNDIPYLRDMIQEALRVR